MPTFATALMLSEAQKDSYPPSSLRPKCSSIAALHEIGAVFELHQDNEITLQPSAATQDSWKEKTPRMIEPDAKCRNEGRSHPPSITT